MPNYVKNIVHITGPAEDIEQAIELMRDKDDNTRIDFNNVIPMPERLNITAGGYDRYYVAIYLGTLCEKSKLSLQKALMKCPVSYYGNYLKKYAESFTMNIPEDIMYRMVTKFKEDYKNIQPQDLRDVGKAYIDNILEYGADTWYDWHIDKWGTKWNAKETVIGDDYLEFETAWCAPLPIIVELSHRFPNLTFSHEWADENLGCNCGNCAVKNGEVIEGPEFDTFEDAHDFACMVWGYGPDDI